MRNHIIASIYSDPAHEALLNSLSASLLEDVAIQGKYHGLQNVPSTEQEYCARIHYKIETAIQEALHLNQSTFQPISGMVVSSGIQQEAKQHCAELDTALQELEPALAKIEKAQKPLHPNQMAAKKARGIFVCTILIALAEGWFAFEAMRAGGMNVVGGILSGLSIAVATALLTHVAATRYINRVTALWGRFWRAVPVCCVMLSFLYFINTYRADALNNQIDLQVYETVEIANVAVSRLLLTVVSFFLFLAALIASVIYGRNSQDRERQKAFDAFEMDAQKLRQQIQVKKQEREYIKQEAAHQSALALARFEYALSCEERLLALAKKAQVAYSEKNLQYRNDGLTPSFFVSPLPFNFRRFFNTTIPDHHEN